MTRIRTDHANNAFTADDFAVAANFLNRSRYSHFTLQNFKTASTLTVKTLANHLALTIICTRVDLQGIDSTLTLSPGTTRMTCFRIFPRSTPTPHDQLTQLLNNVVLRHVLQSALRGLEISLLQQRFILLRHQVILYLGHEIHGHHHNDQK